MGRAGLPQAGRVPASWFSPKSTIMRLRHGPWAGVFARRGDCGLQTSVLGLPWLGAVPVQCLPLGPLPSPTPPSLGAPSLPSRAPCGTGPVSRLFPRLSHSSLGISLWRLGGSMPSSLFEARLRVVRSGQTQPGNVPVIWLPLGLDWWSEFGGWFGGFRGDNRLETAV